MYAMRDEDRVVNDGHESDSANLTDFSQATTVSFNSDWQEQIVNFDWQEQIVGPKQPEPELIRDPRSSATPELQRPRSPQPGPSRPRSPQPGPSAQLRPSRGRSSHHDSIHVSYKQYPPQQKSHRAPWLRAFAQQLTVSQILWNISDDEDEDDKRPKPWRCDSPRPASPLFGEPGRAEWDAVLKIHSENVARSIAYHKCNEELSLHLQTDPDERVCSICMDQLKTVAISCGHMFCDKCVVRMKRKCGVCRKPFRTIIKLYF